MSYSVIRMQKIKAGGVRGIQNHDQRLTDSHTNPDIDTDRSNLNKDLHAKDQRTYHMRIKDRISELDLPKAPRKDAVVLCEFIATSDKPFFDKLSQSEQERFFKESHAFISERYGKENVIHSTIHYDEKTPHLHVGIVPVTADERLSCYQIFNKVELRNLQKDYNEHMNNKGFELEKGESREEKRRHLDTQRYKAQTMDKQVQELFREAKTYHDDIEAFKGQLEGIGEVTKTWNEIDAMSGKETFLSKKKLIVQKGEFETLKDLSKRQAGLSNKLDMLEKQNANLRDQSLGISNMRRDHAREKATLQNENRSLTKELEASNKILDYMKDFLKEVGMFQEATKYLDNQVQRDHQQRSNSRDVGMER